MGRTGVVAALALAASLPYLNAFKCDGGRTILDVYVEDDYCDCADGADEKTTGACEAAKFECANAPHKPKTIFALINAICFCC